MNDNHQPLHLTTMPAFKQHNKELHQKAVIFKNTRRHQHDGGRAWIKDGQLHDAIRDVNPRLVTIKKVAQ
jgi:hypothetical protein